MGYSIRVDTRLLKTIFPDALPNERTTATAVSISDLGTRPQLDLSSQSPYRVNVDGDDKSAICLIFQLIGAMQGPRQFILTSLDDSSGKQQTQIVDLSGKTQLNRSQNCLVYTPNLDYRKSILSADEGHTILTVVPPSVEAVIAVDEKFLRLINSDRRTELLELYRAFRATQPGPEIFEGVSKGMETPVAHHIVMTQYGLTECCAPAHRPTAAEIRCLLDSSIACRIQAINTPSGARITLASPADRARDIRKLFNHLKAPINNLLEDDPVARLTFTPFSAISSFNL